MSYFKDLAGKILGKKIKRDDWVSIDRKYFKGGEKERFTEGIAYRVESVRITPEGKEQIYLVDNTGKRTPIGKHLVHKEKKKK
ncbi:MAG: hypothetical protein V3V26_01425 [Candidatus Aenigmarchaeota archaeon]